MRVSVSANSYFFFVFLVGCRRFRFLVFIRQLQMRNDGVTRKGRRMIRIIHFDLILELDVFYADCRLILGKRLFRNDIYRMASN